MHRQRPHCPAQADAERGPPVASSLCGRPQGGGRRRAGDREALAAIVFVATSGCAWRRLPPVFGPCRQTVYRGFARWSRDRVRARLHRVVLDELCARGEAGS
ncbi:transposase [Streptomyces sp. NPDC057966]|uniref:transposase n=1 Tax=Streptomyces sp. NPDC057966 TaxID=3346292 RepID=UPI0036EA7C4C